MIKVKKKVEYQGKKYRVYTDGKSFFVKKANRFMILPWWSVR